MHRQLLWLLLVFCISCDLATAQEANRQRSTVEFLPNKGQLQDQKGRPLSDILYLLRANNTHILFGKRGIHFEFLQANNTHSSSSFNKLHNDSVKIERIDLEFINANTNPIIEARDTTEGVTHFYTTTPPLLNIKGYKQIRYIDLYPNIDMILTANDRGIKTDYIVKPGGDPTSIKLRYSENAHLEIAKDSLKITAALGSIIDEPLYTYQEQARQQQPVASHFVINDNIVTFAIANYDRRRSLIIDPGRLWGTYYGGSGEDQAIAIAKDGSDNLLVTGYTNSNTNIATSGAYQTTLAGSSDAFVVKFNSSGTRQWATYFGGSEDDRGFAIAVDGSSNAIITGQTLSTAGIATSGAHQATKGNNYDAFLAKFGSNGTLSWATYYGGDGLDQGLGICANASGDVFFTGSTASTNNISSSTSVYQSAYGGGPEDAFIVKFNSSGTRQWGTYYGSSGYEHGHGIGEDGDGNVSISGYTGSTTGIASSSAYQTTQAGSSDAFIAQVNSTGTTRQWGTYFGGSNEEGTEGLVIDGSNNIIIVGQTSSTSGIASSGAQQTSLGGSVDAFIAQFSSSGSRVWSSYFGGSGTDYGQAVALDNSGNIYFTGGSQSSANIATSDAYQTALAGFEDAFCTKFSSSGTLQWSTYYGGLGFERAYGIAVNSSSQPSIVGGTTTTSDVLSTSGATQTSPAGNFDAFVVTFCEGVSKPSISASGPTIFCEGGTVTLTATAGYDNYQWYNRGNKLTSATQRTLVVPSTQGAGINKYVVVVSSAGGCTISSDTATVVISSTPVVSLGSDRDMCANAGTTINATITGGTQPFSYQWSPTAGLSSSTTLTPLANPTTSTTYTLTVTDAAGCVGQGSVRITVVPAPTINAGTDKVICLGDEVVIGDSAKGGTPPYTYSWSPNLWLNSISIPKPKATPIATTNYIVTVTDAKGCQASSSIKIVVNPSPTVDMKHNVQICEGTSVLIGAPAQGATPPYKYQWFPQFGLDKPDSARTLASPLITTVYRLTVTDANGCTTVQDVTVKVNPLPKPTIQPNGNLTLCDGDSIILRTSQSYEGYTWSTNAFTDSIIVKKPGRYSVAVLDGNGCYGWSDTVTVSVLPKPSASITGPPAVCPNSAVIYNSVSQSGDTYQWTLSGGGTISGSSTNASVTINWSAVGTWKLSLTQHSANGCSRDTSLLVTVSSSIKPTVQVINSRVLCIGDSVTLVAQEGFTEYEWSNGVKTRTITITQPGTYFVKVKNGVGCEGSSDPITITQANEAKPIALIAPKDTIICSGDSITLQATTGFASYLWSNGSTSDRITVKDEGSYYYIAFNNAGCAGVSDTAHIQVKNSPLITILGSDSITLCEGTSATLTATPGFDQYLWSTGETTSSIQVSSTGKYYVKGSIKDGCERTSEIVQVTTVPSPKPIITGARKVCSSGTYQYSITGTSSDIIQWVTVGGTIVSGQGTPTIKVQWGAGPTGTLDVSQKISSTCESNAPTLHVTINDSLLPTITATALAICDGDSVTLTADSGYSSYKWSTGETTQNIVIRTAGSYTVSVGDEASCKGTSDAVTISISSHPTPSILPASDVTLCEGDSTILEADQSYSSYQWYKDNVLIPDATGKFLTVKQQGSYSLAIKNTVGCEGISPLKQVTVFAKPTQPVITRNGSTLISTSSQQYQWRLNTAIISGARNQTLTPTDTGDYTVTIIDSNGCENTSLPYHFSTLTASATVGVPILLYSNTGDTVSIPLSLLSSERLRENNATKYTTVIKFNKTLLAPLPPLPLGVENGNNRVITIVDTSTVTTGLLKQLRFIAGLGNDSCTEITIESFEYLDAPVQVLRESGKFCLRDLCYGGGARLFEPEGLLRLTQSYPNPSTDHIKIEFDLLERGQTELYLTNVLGERVKTVFESELIPGSYVRQVDISDLPSGEYFYVLKTPTQRLARTMKIAR